MFLTIFLTAFTSFFVAAKSAEGVHIHPFEGGAQKLVFFTGEGGRHGVYHIGLDDSAILIDPRHPYFFGAIDGAESAEVKFQTNEDVQGAHKKIKSSYKFGFALLGSELLMVRPTGENSRIQLISHGHGPIHDLHVLRSEIRVIDGKQYLYFALTTSKMNGKAQVVVFDEDYNQSDSREFPVDEAANPDLLIGLLVGTLQEGIARRGADGPSRGFSRDAYFTNETLSRVQAQREPIEPVYTTLKELLTVKHEVNISTLQDATVRGPKDEEVSALTLIKPFTRDLTVQFGTKPLIGVVADTELQFRIAETLAARENANVVLTGHPGTGKSMEVDILVSEVANGRGPEFLRGYHFIAVDARSIESGGMYIGQIGNRIDAMRALSKANKIIWVIDEFHSLAGVGTHAGQNTDVTQMLKGEMARGQFQVIGMTTKHEFLQAFGADRAFIERFTQIEKTEPTGQKLKDLILGWATFQEFNPPSNTVLEEAIRIANDFDAIGAQPRKTTRLLDNVYARMKMKGSFGISPSLIDLHQTARDRIGFDPALLDPRLGRQRVEAMSAALDRAVIGQEAAKATLRDGTVTFLAGVHDRGQARMKVLLTGPEGQGKTFLAKAYAESMNLPYAIIEMGQFAQGAPFGKGPLALAADAVAKNAFTVLIFDEIDKCPPLVQEQLLRALGEGRSVVQRELQPGKLVSDTVDFRNSVVIFTANASADLFSKPSLGFFNMNKGLSSSDARALVRSGNISRFLLDRVDDVVVMLPLNQAQFLTAIKSHLENLLGDLSSRGYKIQFSGQDKYLKYLSGFWVAGISNREIERLLRPLRTLVANDSLFSEGPRDAKAVRLKFEGEILRVIDSCEGSLQ